MPCKKDLGQYFCRHSLSSAQKCQFFYHQWFGPFFAVWKFTNYGVFEANLGHPIGRCFFPFSLSMMLQILSAGPNFSPRYFIIMSEVRSNKALPEKQIKLKRVSWILLVWELARACGVPAVGIQAVDCWQWRSCHYFLSLLVWYRKVF